MKGTAEYVTMSVEDTLRELESAAEGLGEADAVKRLGKYGRNEVTQRKRNPLLEFLSRFWGPMPWLLELAIALSVALGHDLEAVIIAVLTVTNAIIGYLHSRGSQRSLELLKEKLAVEAVVRRDGGWMKKNAAEVVPGDVAMLRMGDIVPADAKVLNGALSVDQSALTGESLPVEVGASAILYSSSIVKRGEAQCLIVNTGSGTYFGRTAELVQIARPKSHQEQVMLSIVRYMMYLGVAALVAVGVGAILEKSSIVTVATFAVIFLMGAVPVALPAVLTIVQAVGAMDLVKKGVLVTRLDSMEDAASLDVLCLDKTGTLTMNQLTVTDVIPLGGHTESDVLATAALSASAESQDGIDLAVRARAATAGVTIADHRQISVSPFESGTKRSEAVIEEDGDRFRAVKGAPQVVLSLCHHQDAGVLADAAARVESLSRTGARALAVARSRPSDENELELVGLLALADPPRPEAGQMIADARALGVKPIMVTGDNIAIARQMASQLGIGDRVMRMGELTALPDAEQILKIRECDGLAEVYPEDKYKIVKLFQEHGHITGMTGDGVNDAPALKQAEVGIAVKGATDVAKAAASMVLTEPGIRVIMDALRTSRQIYQRMLTWVINKVTKTIQLIGLLTLGFFWLHDLVVSLMGMALLILANDFVTMTLATDNVKHTGSPNMWNVRNISIASAGIGVFYILEGWVTLLVGRNVFHLAGGRLQSFVLLMLVFASQFRIYIVRERGHFWDSRPGRGILIASGVTIVIFSLLGVFGGIIQPIGIVPVAFLVAFTALFTLGVEIPKGLIFRRLGL
jgi:H+-transporting ATPase